MEFVRTTDPTSWPADKYYEVIANRASGFDGAICILTRLPARTVHPSGLHIHPTDQFFYVLTGTLTVRLGTKTHRAGPDTLVHIPAGLPHHDWNETDEEEMHFELICPHPKDGETSVKLQETKDLPGMPELIRPLDHARFDLDRPMQSEVNLAGRDSGVNSLSWNVFRVKPGGGVSGHHIHGFTHIYWVLRGTMTLQVGIETYKLPQHTLGIVPAGTVHNNWNDTPEPEYHLNIRVPEPDSARMQGMKVELVDR